MRRLHLVCLVALAVSVAGVWAFRADAGTEAAVRSDTDLAQQARGLPPERSPELASLEHRLNRLQLSHAELRAEWLEAQEVAGNVDTDAPSTQSAAKLADVSEQDARDREQTTATLEALDAHLEQHDPDPNWSQTQEAKIRVALGAAGAGKLLASRCAAGVCRVELEHEDRASSELFVATAGTLGPFVGAAGFHSLEALQDGKVRMLYYAARSGTRLPEPEL